MGHLNGSITLAGLPPHRGLILNLCFYRVSDANSPVPFGGDPPASEVGRMVAYKAMCDLLWSLWGVIQHVNGNPADDFWAYAVGRFQRCRALMDAPQYARHLAEIVA